MYFSFLTEDDVSRKGIKTAGSADAGLDVDPANVAAKSADRAFLIAASKTAVAAIRNIDAAIQSGTIEKISHLTPEQMVKLLIS